MKRIAVVLLQDYADWECALLMAACRAFLDVEVVTAAPRGETVVSLGGLKVTPDMSLDALDPADFDAIVFPGGMSWEKGVAPDLNALVLDFHSQGKRVAGICAAASMLAGSGILNSVRHTGNQLAAHQKWPAYAGQALYQDQKQAVSDGRIITAAGTAPVSFTIAILKALDLWEGEAREVLEAISAEYRD